MKDLDEAIAVMKHTDGEKEEEGGVVEDGLVVEVKR